MRNPWILRAAILALCLLLTVWIVRNTRWVEVEEPDTLRGQAASDPYFGLRRVLAGGGSTLEPRGRFEPLPPTGSTLVLQSELWDVFPDRDERLKQWVENGGHLVVFGPQVRAGEHLAWLPLTFKPAGDTPTAKKVAADKAAGKADDEDKDDYADVDDKASAKPSGQDEDGGGVDNDTDDDKKKKDTSASPAHRPPAHRPPTRRHHHARIDPLGLNAHVASDCNSFEEPAGIAQPAFEPGRTYRGCLAAGVVRALHGDPAWALAGDRGTIAVRVPLGRGSVTGVAVDLPLDTQALLDGDNALIVSAVLRSAPGRAVWIIDDEIRESLLSWIWHHARAPLLLGAAALVLALWRLMTRFGPREAPPPQARRSMGEQVRGTGEFIASTDTQALHAATRHAFDEAARARIEGYAGLDDNDRVLALVAELAPVHAIDGAGLRAALHPAPASTPVQWLGAIAAIEQVRRALLRAAAARAR